MINYPNVNEKRIRERGAKMKRGATRKDILMELFFYTSRESKLLGFFVFFWCILKKI